MALTKAKETVMENAPIVEIESQTASSSSELDFETGIDGTYRRYRFEGDLIVPATDGVRLWVRMSTDGGSTYETGASDYAWSVHAHSGAGQSGDFDAGDSEIELTSTAILIGSDTNEHACFTMELYKPSDTSSFAMIGWNLHYVTSGGVGAIVNGTGYYKASTAVDAVRFMMSTGNIESGEITLSGIR